MCYYCHVFSRINVGAIWFEGTGQHDVYWNVACIHNSCSLRFASTVRKLSKLRILRSSNIACCCDDHNIRHIVLCCCVTCVSITRACRFREEKVKPYMLVRTCSDSDSDEWVPLFVYKAFASSFTQVVTIRLTPVVKYETICLRAVFLLKMC